MQEVSFDNFYALNDLASPFVATGPKRSQICSWLRTAREGAKLTRRTVSTALNVTERQIFNWEDPKGTALPPADDFLALVLLYKADVGELLARKYSRATSRSADTLESHDETGGPGRRRKLG